MATAALSLRRLSQLRPARSPLALGSLQNRIEVMYGQLASRELGDNEVFQLLCCQVRASAQIVSAGVVVSNPERRTPGDD